MRRHIQTKIEVADEIVRSVLTKNPPERPVDLGCGDGAFLQALGTAALDIWPGQFADCNKLASWLFGVEKDHEQADQAAKNLSARFGRPAQDWQVMVGDALDLEGSNRFDLVIGNPPWVRLHHLDSATRSDLRDRFRSAKGPFDLCYPFVEKALQLLTTGGHAALVVPMSIGTQPAAHELRLLLDEISDWSLSPLRPDAFDPPASVHAGVLTFELKSGRIESRPISERAKPVLGDIANITSGVPTGADAVFVAPRAKVFELGLETDSVRPAIRGRDIRESGEYSTEVYVIWPYELSHERWTLTDLRRWPETSKYLRSHRRLLGNRPRLAGFIKKNPGAWYRFIDPNRHRQAKSASRIALPDVFRTNSFAVIHDPNTVVLNTCFELTPKRGYEKALLELISSDRFWTNLGLSSRRLSNGFRRTSVTELKEISL